MPQCGDSRVSTQPKADSEVLYLRQTLRVSGEGARAAVYMRRMHMHVRNQATVAPRCESTRSAFGAVLLDAECRITCYGSVR